MERQRRPSLSPHLLNGIKSTGFVPKDLTPTEEDIVRFTPISARPWEFIKQVLVLPEYIKGLNILDVGGGSSDTTARLLEKGANAYALDPCYESDSDLEEKTRWYLEELTKWQMYGLTKMDSPESAKKQKEAFERFLVSRRKDIAHYVCASATSIPFGNNYFNLVFSAVCITGHFDVNKEIFFAAVKECLRVTKPGGLVQLFPWGEPIKLAPSESLEETIGIAIFQRQSILNQGLLLLNLTERDDLNCYFLRTPIGGTTLVIEKKIT